MINNLFFAIVFFLPAGIANTFPVIVAKVPYLKDFNFPLDMGLSIGGVRVLGDHKTVRGMVFGVFFGLFCAFLLRDLVLSFADLNFDYSWFWSGLFLSLGALGGDALKSFFKRRAGIESGKSWIPFDQIDYIVGAVLASLFLYRFSIDIYVYAFLIFVLFHPVFTVIGYFLKLKKDMI